MSSRSRCVISSPNPHRTLIIVLLGGLGAERARKKKRRRLFPYRRQRTEDRKPRHSSYVVARSSERAAHIHPIRRQMIEDDGPNAVKQRTATRIHSLSSRAPEDRSAPPQHGAGRCQPQTCRSKPVQTGLAQIRCRAVSRQLFADHSPGCGSPPPMPDKDRRKLVLGCNYTIIR